MRALTRRSSMAAAVWSVLTQIATPRNASSMVAVRIGPDLCLAAVGAPDYRDDGRQGRSWRRPGLCAEDRVREHTMKGAGLEHAVPLGSSGLSDPHYCVRGVDRVADLRPPLCVGGRRQ